VSARALARRRHRQRTERVSTHCASACARRNPSFRRQLDQAKLRAAVCRRSERRASETPKPARHAGFGLVPVERTMGLEPTTPGLGNRAAGGNAERRMATNANIHADLRSSESTLSPFVLWIGSERLGHGWGTDELMPASSDSRPRHAPPRASRVAADTLSVRSATTMNRSRRDPRGVTRVGVLAGGLNYATPGVIGLP
jgi:hypothetical protein